MRRSPVGRRSGGAGGEREPPDRQPCTASGVAIAAGQQDDGTDYPITGIALDKAKAAALEHTGGGWVTGTEPGDEEGT
jgi:hypothetical protein